MAELSEKEKQLLKENESLKKENTSHKKDLETAENLINELKDKLEASEQKTDGFPIVKNKEKQEVEVLNADFVMPNRGVITLEILQKNPALVSDLLAKKSGNVRLKE